MKLLLCFSQISLVTTLLTTMTLAQNNAIPNANTASATFHPLTPVPIQSVTVNDEFWSPKINVWRGTTLNDTFDKFEKYGGLENFDRVAARQKGGHRGEPWWDGLIYETITGSADFLAAHPDPKLQKRIENYIARIEAAAQTDPDGYVNTGATLDNIGIKWTNPPAPGDNHNDNWPHTIYNAGCLVEAGVHWNRATGQTNLLRVATRLANYMTGIMGPAPRQNIIPGHALPEQAFVNLYRLYHEQPALKAKVGLPVDENAYLELAEFWIENRGNTQGREGAGAGAYNQDDKPVFAQAKMEGHAVRSGLLATGIATAARVNKDPQYLQTGARWWSNMVAGKMYVTGGLGAIPSIEGFGADYDLPNNGYAETCAAVAGGFFSHNMNMATGDAKYVDVLERELYNGALSGVSLAGDTYFYTNPLNSGPDHRRWEWNGGGLTGTPCCPPMFVKLQGAFPGYLYATDADGVYVNLYAGSQAQINSGRLHLTLEQKTNYPWNGAVQLAVNPQRNASFALNLRIPGWAKNATLAVNGKAVALRTVNNYARIERAWKKGDTVTLNLPMPVERVQSDPRVAANEGKVSLMRGPIVYCLEGLDNGGPLQALTIAPTAQINAQYRPDLLGGVTVLSGTAQLVRERGEQISSEPQQFTAIPFYANSNRQPTTMQVWMAKDVAHASPLTLTSTATPTASHCFANDTVSALNDDIAPKTSDDETVPRLTWWDHRGTQEWAQLTFEKIGRVEGVQVYWWDERRVGRDCRVPQRWKIQYLDGDEWKDVGNASAYGTELDAFNKVTFDAVNTKALRVVAQLQPQWSGGILEWRVTESQPK